MKRLTLIRHGKSSWDNETLQDFERPLSARGWRDSPRMADLFATYEQLPDQWVSSFATRALTTARVFAHHLHYPVEKIVISEQVYEVDAGSLLDYLRVSFPTSKHIALFGHNPGLEDLAETLCPGQVKALPTCAIVQLKIDVKQWNELAPGSATLERLDFPKKFR
ncbi:MAG TPA: histidine phosphatase family protein [Dongiaceae bacterium]|nr:histidine phosphatase family protein [Dongiaceae bacterium]